MAWEERSGRLYYYRKRREGRRVVSEYVGIGELANLAAALDALGRMERESKRKARREEREAEEAITAELERLGDIVRTVTAMMLLSTGHHTHKGQWRRKREP